MKKLAEERISIDPNVCSGKPVIKGTRVQISDILLALAEGLSNKEILRNFRQIRDEDIKAALAYSYCMADGINISVKSSKGKSTTFIDNDLVKKEEIEEAAKKVFSQSLEELASMQEEITEKKLKEVQIKKEAEGPVKLQAPDKKDYDLEIELEDYAPMKIFTAKNKHEQALDMEVDNYIFEYRDKDSWLIYSAKDGVEIDTEMKRKIKLIYKGKEGLFEGYLTTDRMNKIFIAIDTEKDAACGRVL